MSELHDCHDCAAKPGEMHTPSCDVERCPRCGMQSIGCNCVYIVNGIDVDTMEEEHPDIYNNGPTAAMHKKFDDEYASKRKPCARVRMTPTIPTKPGWYKMRDATRTQLVLVSDDCRVVRGLALDGRDWWARLDGNEHSYIRKRKVEWSEEPIALEES